MHKNLCLILLLVAATPALAQRGDRGKEKQPEVWKQMKVPAGTVVPADKALSTFVIAPNFRLEMVASEPLIEDPVAVAWDADGRPWVVEMRGYMPNVDGKGEDVRNGRITVLQDTNGDGRMDKSTVFLDKLQMPRAIAMVKGGILVSEPPILWYCRDTDGDLKCDDKVEVYKGYARQGPVEHTENGLMLGLDGWMYNAKSSRRLKFSLDSTGKPKLIVASTRGRGQWGITQDNYGRLYYNGNSNYLQADFVPADYLERNPYLTSRSGVGGSIASDQSVWTIRVNPGVNRGYRGGTLRKDGRLNRTTATCGPGIYRGDQYPAEYIGNAFIPEPSGNVVSRFAIEEQSNGTIRGKHIAYDDPKWEKREFLACTDERFRPINAYTGPDGCLYIVDMYRGILQHRVFVTSFLRKQILERGLDKPIGMGRIYRVVYTGKGARKPAAPIKMSKMKSADLAKQLSNANGWVRDTAQRLLIERNDKSSFKTIADIASESKNPLGQIHALWTLRALGQLDEWTVTQALETEHPHALATAIRMTEPILKQTSKDADVKKQQLNMANDLLAYANHSSPIVRKQLAFTLGEIRVGQVEVAMRTILLNHGSDSAVRDAILSGLGGRELEFLRRLSADPKWLKSGKGLDSIIKELSACVVRQRYPQRIAYLLALIASQPANAKWRQLAMLDGMASAAQRRFKAIHFANQPKGLATLNAHKDGDIAKRAGKLKKTVITWGKPPAAPKPPRPLTTSEQKLFIAGKTLFLQTCASCHMASGLGEEGKAPPLQDSPYLLGPPAQLIRIVKQGLIGPVDVHGRTYDMEMPALKGFSDQQIASILTYARREWEHGAEPITPAAVTAVGKETAGRELPWTVEQLKKIIKGSGK
jgi:putative membrane-bound dehydrogenase-like protein